MCYPHQRGRVGRDQGDYSTPEYREEYRNNESLEEYRTEEYR